MTTTEVVERALILAAVDFGAALVYAYQHGGKEANDALIEVACRKQATNG